MKIRGTTLVLIIYLTSFVQSVFAEEEQPALVNIKRMSLDIALRIGQAAISQCRKEGVQIAVTVIDRGGHPQVVLRDVLAMDLALPISQQKAYTAMSFNMKTSAMEGRFKSSYSVPKLDSLIIASGGIPVTSGGNIIGGVGVSGSPSGEIDEKCAQAGVDAVIDDLEMAAM